MKLAIALTALVIAARPATAQPPQSPLEAWINDPFHTTEGRIRLTGQRHNTYHRGYRCPDFQVANFVIATLEKSHLHEKTAKGQRAILLRVLAHQGCQPALRGDYLPLELGTMTSIDGGFEASEDWTALRVKAPDGAEIGLVYDASIYAMD